MKIRFITHTLSINGIIFTGKSGYIIPYFAKKSIETAVMYLMVLYHLALAQQGIIIKIFGERNPEKDTKKETSKDVS